ncbi:hypothetical protein DVJ83_17025 (plasmid) [Deinococcus wulumuqiensis]|uniref:Uncharacterized protein n=1 Tax=Deinococcus wulumuqiensis TaxID=980427 RepID=A0A345IMA5_9DEIO|nr:hypothetical protein [Deinococcus wulumuqiensis]AXH00828.1 hypothetical protein DVJ83_17025 [Deinococcus wulumuqiensis]
MANPPPERLPPTRRPEFVMSVWRDASGAWQGRLKSLQDGAERLVADLRDLPGVLDTCAARGEPHA